MEKDPYVLAQNDALKLLSFRARTSAELAKRLREKGHADEYVGRVIEFFSRQRLVDDRAYAEEFTRSRGRQGAAGRRKIERELKARGVPASAIAEAMAQYGPEEELQRALDAAARRVAAWKDLPKPKQRQRLFGFLARRGFSSDAIQAAFKKLLDTQVELE